MKATKLIISPSTNPYFNLSLEEWALLNLELSHTNYLMLYVNEPSVVVGRNQNIFEEANINYCIKNQIHLCRRISGGGTVFHDLGNLNWGFIAAQDIKKVNSYEWAVAPLFKVLQSLGLKPYLTSRNAIEIDGLKISGQAQFTKKKSMISHGTLLVDSALNTMQPSIESPQQQFTQSKSSKSVRSKVANINSLSKQPVSVQDFIAKFKADYEEIPIDFSQINTEKLRADAWVYERSPKFYVHHEIDKKSLRFFVQNARIEGIENKNGQIVKDCPFENMFYKEFLTNY